MQNVKLLLDVKMKDMEQKDLCKTCIHFWMDFPLPLENAEPHCEILDSKHSFTDMDNYIPYPCTKCPFNSYVKK